MTHPSVNIQVPDPDRWQYPGQLSHPADPYVTWKLRHPGNNPIGVTKPARLQQLSKADWKDLHDKDEDKQKDKKYKMTQIPAEKTGSPEGYPWVVHLYARNLEESLKWEWPSDPNGSQAARFNSIIPTQWVKGTAWFARGVSNDDRAPIYLMTAAHNLVKKAPRKIDEWGRPLQRGQLSQRLSFGVTKEYKKWPYKAMHKSRARADAVLIVAEIRPDPQTGGVYKRFEAWADMACISQQYLKDPNGSRLDIAALRLRKGKPFPSDFPSDVLSNAPYIHSLPPEFEARSDAYFMGVGIPGFLDKYRERGGTYLLRDPADRIQHAEGVVPNVFNFSSSSKIKVRKWQGYKYYVPWGIGKYKSAVPYTPYDHRFEGTLTHKLPYERMPPGVSGGPGILGVFQDKRNKDEKKDGDNDTKDGEDKDKDEDKGKDKLEMVVCCMVIEDADDKHAFRPNHFSGGAVFSSSSMAVYPTRKALKAADPAVLLTQLGAKGLGWEPVKFGGQEYKRLSRRLE
ncbi:hypothetical protein N657DRAFT_644274 [Parathielavia appendiculata]|uniref:Serine protease n=1 Tax=Parathielavia appendiculata TaxID=2587402 RepID=A0AAN6U0D2_9PEZI|nr:hypothetical protein N657DRAFT_644274 [Parathielavia appendiculata]